MIQRIQYQQVIERMNEPRLRLQIIVGSRQVGKTTLVKQLVKQEPKRFLFFTAEEGAALQSSWITACWETARTRLLANPTQELVLILDEIQKIPNWSETVKREWDADTFNDVPLKVILLGSSRVLIQKGLSESLAGRYELIRLPHWSFAEMRDAFGFSIEQYIYFGGFPGAATYINDEARWRDYVRDSICDAAINRDVLLNSTVAKPALLRQTFELSSAYSGECVSLTKMVGALQDAGNTTTLTSYLQLLNDSCLVAGLPKFVMDKARQRASVPKYQVYNSAIKTIYTESSFLSAQQNKQLWGRLYESAIGAHLINEAYLHPEIKLSYWREGNQEVDFVLKRYDKVIAIEVKSNEEKDTRGLHTFTEKFHPYRTMLVGKGGIDIESFLLMPILNLFQ